MKKDWIKKVLPSGQKSSALLVFAGALGLFLLIAGGVKTTAPEKREPPGESRQSQYTKDLERKLTRVVSKIEGAGNAEVVLTLETGEENIYAQDERTDRDGQSGETRHILMNAQNGQQPLVRVTWEPEIRGIAVICEGADNPKVAGRIMETVSVLAGVSTNRISIAKMS